MLKIGIIGYGYWGPNLVRNFNSLDAAKILAVCDKAPESLEKVRRIYPGVGTCTDYRDITSSPEIDAVVIVTPVFSHYELARRALENGKHVFVEKPFTSTSAQAEELLEMAHKKGLKIMVDHTFLFTGAVKKIKELVDQGVLGDLFYYDSMRVNLGLFQHDVNVVWDLAPHDLSVMDYVIKSKPLAISATGMDHFGRKTENIAYITVYLEDNAVAHFNVNWLSPVKIRTTLIGGSKRMAVWNDLEADEKVKIYDKGIDIGSREGIYNLLVNYRSGDMWAPKLERAEALKTESEYFVNCIMNGVQPINDGHAGLRVVRMLEASDSSIRARGRIVEL